MVDVNRGKIEQLEQMVNKLDKVLHRNHFYILEMKYMLSQLYGKAAGYLIHEMTDIMLERKERLCEDILRVYDVLQPGLSTVRGDSLGYMFKHRTCLSIISFKGFPIRMHCRQNLLI